MSIIYATDDTCMVFDSKIYISESMYKIINRYSKILGKIILCSRKKKVFEVPKGYKCPDFIENVINPQNLMEVLIGKNKNIRGIVKNATLVIGRVPSIIAYYAINIARKNKIPYLTEVMGCPWDAYWNHGIIGKLIAPYMYFEMRRLVKNANYAIYVTKKFLQSRYPTKCKYICASNVDIEIPNEEFLNKRVVKIKTMNVKDITLLTTAAINVKYKGQQYVIRALNKLKKKGVLVNYYLAGDGDKSYLLNVAKKNNVKEQVHFLGRLSHDEVLNLIDNIDIYVQPSLQEGLPRAVIEAMSRGCICLGAKTAGIPEIIPQDCIFKRASVKDFCKCLNRLLLVENKAEYAKTNYNNSKEYCNQVLDQIRNDYLISLKDDISKMNEA